MPISATSARPAPRLMSADDALSRILAAVPTLPTVAVGLLASLGRARIRVTKRPRVAVFSTGDEIVDAGAALAPGQIRDSNRYSLAAAIRAAGSDPVVGGIVPDDPGALRAALVAASSAD